MTVAQADLLANSALTAVTEQLESILNTIKNFREPLVNGLIVLVLFLAIAAVLKFVIRVVAKKIGVDFLSEKVGLKSTLGSLGISAPLSKVVSSIVFWMIAFYSIKAASDIWGIKDLSAFVNAVIQFLPKLFTAIFILLAGIIAADTVRKAIRGSLDNFGIEYGGVIGNLIYGLLVVIIATVVLSQLGIQTDLLNAAVKILLAASGLAIALAMGFGLRPVARNVVSGVYARDLFPPGSAIEIEGELAVVREVGAVAARLETIDEGFIIVPNSQLVTTTNRGRSISGQTRHAEKV